MVSDLRLPESKVHLNHILSPVNIEHEGDMSGDGDVGIDLPD